MTLPTKRGSLVESEERSILIITAVHDEIDGLKFTDAGSLYMAYSANFGCCIRQAVCVMYAHGIDR